MSFYTPNEIQRLNERITKSRIRFTASGDTKSRFERRVLQVHGAQKEADPSGMCVIRVDKPAPSAYALRYDDRVYFDPVHRKWFVYTKDGVEIIFLAELVGSFFLTKRAWMEELGLVIAGHDLRHVLFRVLYENRKDLLQQPLAIAQTVNKKGDEL